MEFFNNKHLHIFSSAILVGLVVLLSGMLLHNVAYSDEYDDLTKKIADLKDALSQSQRATKPLQTQLTSLKSQLVSIDNQVTQIEADLFTKKKNIDEGYKKLSAKQKLFDATVKKSYIKTYTFSPLLIFLSGNNISDITSMLTYQKRDTEQDKNIITNIALQLVDLEERKAKLEDEQNKLVVAKASLDKERAEVQKVVDGAVAYQNTLTGQIAALSARQQDILAQKLGSLHIPQSAYAGIGGGCSSDLTNGKDPGFSPRFGFFTYGIPNRVGLNQYGAKGRAEAGQNAEQILSAYYQNYELKKDYNTGINIHVTGSNEYGQSFDTNWDIETYVKHVYEIPTNWPTESLKAQAIAARSYALAYTNNGSGNICPSQQCQVVKQEINSDAWQQAVDATRGWVMTSGGNPIKAWFSSTHGGYVFSSSDIGWNGTPFTKSAKDTSTDSISSFSDLQNNAYDKTSPWFYCDWGSRSQYGGTAWLKSEEVADITNVLLLAKADSSTQTHLSQPDKPNPDGTDTWDAGKVKQELQRRGIGAFNSVSDVSVSWDTGSGRTTQVTINGDAGSKSFNAVDFKNYFNLRAPANIQIVGPLYNIEKK
jgi:SpoIID/LytB domain protein